MIPRWACGVIRLGMFAGLAVALAGCHTVLHGPKPASFGSGHGRVDRPVPAGIGPALRATMATLDEQGVHPTQLVIHSLVEEAGHPGAVGIEPEATNAAMVPTGTRFDDLFSRHQVATPDGKPAPFVPRLVTYAGATADKQTVLVTIAARRNDESNSLVTVRVGRTGDDAWSRAFLDRVGARTGANPEQSASSPPNPTLPN